MKKIITYLLIVTLVLVSRFSFVMCDIDDNGNGNGKLVTVANSFAATSTDDINWMRNSDPNFGNFGYGIAYGN